ncbi:MAG TPA: 4'-phosphopantetheinyl transferase superfamily protein [Flavobacterium sp.]
MIGNDIIDLQLAAVESNWTRKGFLEKIFNPSEIEIIFLADNHFLMVWILWSMKESAYKIYNRKTGRRSFNPKYFLCSLNKNTLHGTVVFEEKMCYTKTVVSIDLIDTICSDIANDFVNINTAPSEKLIRLNGKPFVQIDDDLLPASLSQHGRFKKAIYIN